MSENKQQSETDIFITSKSQGSVATYLMCDGIFSIHIATNQIYCWVFDEKIS